ncbi:MAG: murein biosynthesis integral membrane protein MurJ [Anaerolineae bacterium]|jgi:putative peptidoglycan lipid II flippase|nr:murein biosynthesis integral membrane protein MurJ [Anaerolineae bacterium]MBT7073375.1 murein biosynthesis integral membrane protein MurJ [Anaerolineae bacterium]MBT7783127.1 murein biosynthesis integral membrane protein MurJ [Anaerolineae bacterium]
MKKLSFLTRTSFLIGGFFALDKGLAFLRSIIIARQFNLSFELDAFNVANNLPDMLFALISGGAMSMALIPVLSDYLATRGRPAAWKLFSRIANLAFLVTAFFSILIAIFAEQIVRAEMGIAPGFGVEEQNTIIALMRLNLLATAIFSVSGLVMGGLQANQHFLLPAMAPMLYNIGQIFGALVFSPSEPYSIAGITLPALGLGVYGLVYGVILGAALHLGIQIPGLIKYQFRWSPSLTIKDEGVRQALKIMGPRLITMLGIQLVFIARDNFASRLEVGAVTALTYGWMIMQVPETLLGTAIATAILPTLSEYAAKDQWIKFRETIEKAIRVMIALTLPAATILSAGLLPLVRLVFGFDVGGTALLTWTARAFLLTLAGYAIQEVLSRAFYARKEALIPLLTIFLRFSLYIATGIIVLNYFPHLSAAGLALAELAVVVEAAVMLSIMNIRLPTRVTALPSLLRGLTAAILGGASAYAIALYLPGGAVITAIIGMFVGVVIALPIIWKEVRLLFNL